MDDLISEHEAAVRCGVSTRTLERFVETGNLKAERGEDGAVHYRCRTLSALFGVSFEKAELPAAAAPNPEDPHDPGDAGRPESAETAYPKPESRHPIPESRHPKPESRHPEPESAHPEYESGHPEQESRHPEQESRHPEPPKGVRDLFQSGEVPRSARDDNPGEERLEKEILRLQNISDMQEKLLEIREGQIAELKDQRLWLQNRIERLEQAASEDRILLLASSETARRLASKEKRSPVRALLEWAGVTLPEKDEKDPVIV